MKKVTKTKYNNLKKYKGDVLLFSNNLFILKDVKVNKIEKKNKLGFNKTVYFIKSCIVYRWYETPKGWFETTNNFALSFLDNINIEKCSNDFHKNIKVPLMALNININQLN